MDKAQEAEGRALEAEARWKEAKVSHSRDGPGRLHITQQGSSVAAGPHLKYQLHKDCCGIAV